MQKLSPQTSIDAFGGVSSTVATLTNCREAERQLVTAQAYCKEAPSQLGCAHHSTGRADHDEAGLSHDPHKPNPQALQSARKGGRHGGSGLRGH